MRYIFYITTVGKNILVQNATISFTPLFSHRSILHFQQPTLQINDGNDNATQVIATQLNCQFPVYILLYPSTLLAYIRTYLQTRWPRLPYIHTSIRPSVLPGASPRLHLTLSLTSGLLLLPISHLLVVASSAERLDRHPPRQHVRPLL